MIHRRYREIPLFVAGLVTEVWILLFSGVPYAGLGIDVVKAVVDALVDRTSSKMKNSGSGPK